MYENLNGIENSLFSRKKDLGRRTLVTRVKWQATEHVLPSG